MSLSELLPAIYALPRQEKFRLMQELLTDLAQEDGIPEGEYPVWSPYEAHKAAAILMRMLEEERQQKNHSSRRSSQLCGPTQ